MRVVASGTRLKSKVPRPAHALTGSAGPAARAAGHASRPTTIDAATLDTRLRFIRHSLRRVRAIFAAQAVAGHVRWMDGTCGRPGGGWPTREQPLPGGARPR